MNNNLRGILFQLTEGLGSIPRRGAGNLISALHKDDFSRLRRLGVWVGACDVFMEVMIRPKSAQLCSLLWAVHHGQVPIPEPLPAGRVSLARDSSWPTGFLYAAGYRPAGGLVLRIDIAERLVGAIEEKMGRAGSPLTSDILNLAGCTEDHISGVLSAIGFKLVKEGEGAPYIRRHKSNRSPKAKRKAKANKRLNKVDLNSPFAKLQDLALS